MCLNPANPDSFNHQLTKLSTGRTYHYVDQLPANYDVNKTVTLLLIHGFPDLWYTFFRRKHLRLLIMYLLSGLPGNTKLALGLRLGTVSSPRTCWVTVRPTNRINLRSIHSKSSPMTSLLFSTTSVPRKRHVLLPNH
jgi:hypothetical protein